MEEFDPPTRAAIRGAMGLVSLTAIVLSIGVLLGWAAAFLTFGVLLLCAAEMDRRAEREGR